MEKIEKKKFLFSFLYILVTIGSAWDKKKLKIIGLKFGRFNFFIILK